MQRLNTTRKLLNQPGVFLDYFFPLNPHITHYPRLTRHINMLFKVTHVGTFNTSVQSLSLLHQLAMTNPSLSSRFYRTLYETLLDRRLYTSNKQALYLNLLYKAMGADPSLARCGAFLKRLLQVCVFVGVPFVCASLYLVGQVAKARPGVWAMVSLPEDMDDEDGEEKFFDVKDEEDEEEEKQKLKKMEEVDEKKSTDNNKPSTGYDGLKRDPLYANADRSCFWELVRNYVSGGAAILFPLSLILLFCQIPFLNHFHPTVTHYASVLLSQSQIPTPLTTNYDPLQNHTLARFLDRFVNKNPKKVEAYASKGNSAMQPRGTRADDMLFLGGTKKRNVVVVEGADESGITGGGRRVAMDDKPVNEVNWDVEESKIPVDEVKGKLFLLMFFFKSFL